MGAGRFNAPQVFRSRPVGTSHSTVPTHRLTPTQAENRNKMKGTHTMNTEPTTTTHDAGRSLEIVGSGMSGLAKSNAVAPKPTDPQPRRVAEQKLKELTLIQRFVSKREWARFLAKQSIAEERSDCDYYQAVLQAFRETKLEAFREFYGAELIKFGIEVRAGLAEYATAAHQRLEEAVVKAEAAYLETIRKKIALYDSFQDLPDHTAILRAKLLPDMEKFMSWTGSCIDHAKAAFQERVKRI